MSGKGRGIKPLELGLLQSETERRAVIDAAAADAFRRLVARADALGIPPWLLVWESLMKYDPTFKQLRNDGRPKKWNGLALITLADLVALAMHVGLTKVRACEYLAGKDPWLSAMEGRPDGKALEKQCTKHRLAAARKTVAEAVAADMLDDLVAQVRQRRDFLSQREKQK